ncbi:uncharacterized protein LOC118756626 [Rhagoletis pomonella]|uniref:uncharacterized protein LOC118756626 n=1 Tax=Rhagoletis pomonella TaxID=28610 RepID=UPI00178581D0|nr:uncharacterized protein LOC118756626 [Rhagoletis pomonella]
MNVTNFTKVPIANHYKYGLSTLHAWIRCFECLLHIAYRLTFKCWQVRKENKDAFSANKVRIQNEFRTRLGLIVDQVKTGFGTTNDGNTARKFFSNAEVASEITGINKDLIQNFSIILRLISCGMRINIDAFRELLIRTRTMYLTEYEWYYMPSSVHKILMHGCEVIEYFDLPIGNFSEEALEALHKHIRIVRYDHTRKTAREHTNRDLMSYLTISSDPEVVFKRSAIPNKNAVYTMDELEEYLVDAEET